MNSETANGSVSGRNKSGWKVITRDNSVKTELIRGRARRGVACVSESLVDKDYGLCSGKTFCADDSIARGRSRLLISRWDRGLPRW